MRSATEFRPAQQVDFQGPVTHRQVVRRDTKQGVQNSVPLSEVPPVDHLVNRALITFASMQDQRCGEQSGVRVFSVHALPLRCIVAVRAKARTGNMGRSMMWSMPWWSATISGANGNQFLYSWNSFPAPVETSSGTGNGFR
jgi:hypothetical protein